MIKDCTELTVHLIQIGTGVGHALFIPVIQQFVLPCDNIPGFNICDRSLTEPGKDLCADHIFLRDPRVLFEPVLPVDTVLLNKHRELHIQICCLLHEELTLPGKCLLLRCKVPLHLFPADTITVFIIERTIPCSFFHILIRGHLNPPFYLQVRRPAPGNTSC